MRTNLTRQNEEAFALLRTSFSRLNLPVEMVDELIDRHIAVSFEKGAMAFCEGNTDGMLACILSGYVNVCCSVGDGYRTLVRMAGPGEIIGYPDYIDEKGRPARMFEAQAATKCTLALFSRDHIAQMLAALPAEALTSMVATLNTLWSENLRRFALLLGLPFWNRLRMVMSDLAKRAGVRDSEGVILIPEIRHEDLAEMIGCSRPMVSRLVAEMIESKLLARRGNQYVLLKKWDLGDDGRDVRKFGRGDGKSAGRTSPRAIPASSANGSASRGVTAYAARGSN